MSGCRMRVLLSAGLWNPWQVTSSDPCPVVFLVESPCLCRAVVIIVEMVCAVVAFAGPGVSPTFLMQFCLDTVASNC